MIKRALCIGNSSYPEEPLRNPTNDAIDLSNKLRTLGFNCNVLSDAGIQDMEESLKKFSDELANSEVGLFFFAGHGLQIDGDNYLTAINTKFENEIDAKFSSLPLNKAIEVLEKGANSTSIIILDACRNNPYERRWRGVGSRGLAAVYAPKGTIIAFATSPGQVALDGDNDNGAFTAALLKHISSQNVTIEDLFKRVRITLSATTSGKQISWEHTSLMGDFFFNTAVLMSDFITEYSQQALADTNFECLAGRPISEIIEMLRTHNWHKQNPSIAALSGIDWALGTKDELFVLGRNLYQTACGGSHAADSYFTSLAQNMRSLEEEIAFHILNGMLYEIYFDSNNRFRLHKKTEKLDEVFRLEEAEEFSRSFDFIQQSLIQHQKQTFYIPGSRRDVIVDVDNLAPIDNKSEVKRIAVDGLDVFYTQDGETLVANSEIEFHLAKSVTQFEIELAKQMVVPGRHMHVTYSREITGETSLSVPYDYRIQRFSP